MQLIRPRSTARGMIAVQFVLSLSVLVGVAALIVDGGLLMAERRHAQAAADAAALAGAVDLYTHYPNNAGYDTSGTADGSARSVALANYPIDPENVSMTVHIPPVTAENSFYNGKAGYIEVEVTYSMARGFSGIWGSSRIPVKARSVAQGRWAPPDFAILSLASTGASEFNVSGGGTVHANGGSIVIDSNDSGALKDSGGGTVTADGGSIYVVGGFSGGGTFSSPPTTGAMAIENPLKSLAVPTPPAAGIIDPPVKNGNGTTYTMSPGSYDGNGGPPMPKLSSGDVAVFKQASSNSAGGIYYLYNGLTSTGGSMSMDTNTTGGIMFYNAGVGSSKSLSISGNGSGTVSLSALDGTVASTLAYKGLIYYQARSSTQDVSVSGNGSFSMKGTFYAPDAGLKVTGNSSTPPSTIGSQYIANTLTVSGGGTVLIDYKSGLVAPARFINLVE